MNKIVELEHIKSGIELSSVSNYHKHHNSLYLLKCLSKEVGLQTADFRLEGFQFITFS